MSSLFSPKKSVIRASAVLLGFTSLLMSGCAFSGGAGGDSGSGGTLHAAVKGHMQGAVIGGQNPIKGAVIQLYQVGQSNSSSYTANAIPLISSVIATDQYGNFDITGKYNCASGTYLYLTAAGGDPQLSGGSATTNNQITLLASVGLCDDLKPTTFIAVNEVTTVATAYVYAQFARTTPFGTALATQSTSAATPAFNIATSSTNLQGIANAAAMYKVLVNTVDGSSPGSNGTGTLNNPLTVSSLSSAGATGAVPEFWQINTIADILAACVNSTGISGAGDTTSNCAVLMANVSPFNGNAPADTAQAALGLALAPAVASANIANLYGMIPPTAPFVPYVMSAASINDFSIAVIMKPVVPGTTTELLLQPGWLGTDAYGNIWVTQTKGSSAGFAASALELSPIGVPVRAGTGTTFTAADYLINSYTMNGSTTAFGGQYRSSTVVGKLLGTLDTNSNFWLNDRANDSVFKVIGSGATIGAGASATPHNGGNAGDAGGNGAVGYPLAAGSGPIVTVADGSNNIWTILGNVTPASPASGSCGGTSYSAYTLGTVGFLGGDPSNGAYSPTAYTGATYVAIDPNVNDTYTPSGGSATAIPGAPFLWTPASSLLLQQYTTTSGSAKAGCASTVSSIASPSGGTTNLNGITVATSDVAYPLGSSTLDAAFDAGGNLWIARAGKLDANAVVPTALVKLAPNYGTAFTAAQMAANTTFNYYYTGGMSSSFTVRTVQVDGDGNAWATLNNVLGLTAYTNSGVAFSPTPATGTGVTYGGFVGSTCTGCKYRGETAQTYQRQTNNAGQTRPTFDLSGNVWSPLSGTNGAAIVVLIGAAAPTVEPLSLGLKNKTLATRP